jgi:hypothetical protein
MRAKNTIFRPLLYLIFACSLQACGSSGSDDQSRNDDPSQSATLLSGSALGVRDEATELRAEISCDPAVRRKGLAQLSWTPADPPGQEQKIVFTIFKEGFESGAFEESKPLPSNQDSFLLETVHGQAVHRWRVLTVTATAEIPSDTARFEGPVCIGDVVVEEPAPIP